MDSLQFVRIFVVTLSILTTLSASFPAQQPSNAIALSQPTNAVAFPRPSVDTAANSTSIRADHVHVQVHGTDFVINKDTGGHLMPFSLTSRLLRGAGVDIQRKIAQYGRNYPLLGNYQYRHQSLHFKADRFVLEHEIFVTYEIVSDMITALENKLWQVDDMECDVDILLVVHGRYQDVGYGLLGFNVGSTADDLNSTSSSSSSSQNTTSLGVNQWECQVGNTLLVIKKNSNGRRMPILESLQLLNEVSNKLQAEIEQHGGETRLVGQEFTLYFQNLGLEAYEWLDAQAPLTYDMVVNMVTALKDSFWRVNYVESTVDIYNIGSRVLAKAGFGIISFRNIRDRMNSTEATIEAPSRNRTITDE